jgi:hypothetical protein
LAKWNELKNLLSRHEATIQKRWLKKTQGQRTNLLQTARPILPSNHRPDFEEFRTRSKLQLHADRIDEKTRYAFMLPYLNLQVLRKARTMLLMLNARKQHPSVFAAADRQAMQFGCVTKAIHGAYLNNHVVVLNGVTGSEEYGRLRNWEAHPDAFRRMAERRQFLPSEALLILEA